MRSTQMIGCSLILPVQAITMARPVQLENPQAVLQTLMRNSFRAFLRKAYPWVSGGDMIAWNWHLDAIAYQLDRVAAGDSQRWDHTCC